MDEQQRNSSDPPSTGFLPLSMAIALFVTGLFVLDLVPLSCDPSEEAKAAEPVAPSP